MTRTALLLLSLLISSSAQATVYKCVDDRGRTTYTNDRNLAKGCQPMSSDAPVSSVPAQRASTPPAAARPATTSPNFPSVSAEDQKARDSGRREILQAELKNEEAALAAAREEFKIQEESFPPEERNVGGGINGAKRNARLQQYSNQVELHERNIESLKREFSRLR